jgi:hypothetical protein
MSLAQNTKLKLTVGNERTAEDGGRLAGPRTGIGNFNKII